MRQQESGPNTIAAPACSVSIQHRRPPLPAECYLPSLGKSDTDSIMPYKDEQIVIIAPGSLEPLAQLRIPEPMSPAALRVRSRMFPAQQEGEWEPYKVRQRKKSQAPVPQP